MTGPQGPHFLLDSRRDYITNFSDEQVLRLFRDRPLKFAVPKTRIEAVELGDDVYAGQDLIDLRGNVYFNPQYGGEPTRVLLNNGAQIKFNFNHQAY